MSVLRNQHIGFIGMGTMAQTIFKGLQTAYDLQSNQVSFVEINQDLAQTVTQSLGIKQTDLETLCAQSTLLLFCVKPQNIVDILQDFPSFDTQKTLCLSILAGTTIKTFLAHLPEGCQIVRVMPNTPALVGQGMSALSYSPAVTETHKHMACHLFKGLGEVVEVDEQHMDIVTGISGSGPAFFYRIADQIRALATQLDMDSATALTLVAQTMVGAGTMLLQSGKQPDVLIKEVTSPNGTTAAGLEAFGHSQIDTDIQQVVHAAITRSKALSKGDLS